MGITSSLISTLAFALSLLFIVNRTNRRQRTRKHVAIVVLGDIGRSPRMLYHASSLASHGWKVDIVSYSGSQPPKLLVDHSNINFFKLKESLPFFSTLPKLLFVFLAPWKVLSVSFSLMRILLWDLTMCPSWILVQNPPAIPTLPVVQFARLLCGSKLMIDWHNTAYSVLALRLGSRNLLVKFAKWIEGTFGQYAAAHLFVTKAEQGTLTKQWNLKGQTIVYYDRPPSHFRPLTIEETHKLWLRLPILSDPTLKPFLNTLPPTTSTSTIFTSEISTHPNQSRFESRPDRPALIVSSTSWTADEDFSILINALSLYATSTTKLPPLLCLVTGKGPLLSHYKSELERRSKDEGWELKGKVAVRTVWLEAEDYPKLLACADLGVSLHQSSSGLDLPMKVVDMFGCQVPVCARYFDCVDELVKNGKNGVTFNSADDLFHQFASLLKDFPAVPSPLDALRSGITSTLYGADDTFDGISWEAWEQAWDRVVLPIL